MDQEARDLVRKLITAARPMTPPPQNERERSALDGHQHSVRSAFSAIRATTVIVQAAQATLANATSPAA